MNLRQSIRFIAVSTVLAAAFPVQAHTSANADVGVSVTVAAVGDMACDSSDPSFSDGLGTPTACRQLAVSDVLLADTSVTAVLGLGDYQYDCGDLADYAVSYNPTWGRLDSLMDPVAGNHEYKTGNDVYGAQCPVDNSTATNYFSRFGAAAHPETAGHFSFDLGSWHLIGLNANCIKDGVGGCSATSAQTVWLKADLAATSQPCVLAFWHQPRFQGLKKSVIATYRPWWRALYAAHADLILNGHIHNYQRYAAMNPAGVKVGRGITQYIVGTGGEAQVPTDSGAKPFPAFSTLGFGYLRLTLSDLGWDSVFIDEFGNQLDAYHGSCV